MNWGLYFFLLQLFYILYNNLLIYFKLLNFNFIVQLIFCKIFLKKYFEFIIKFLKKKINFLLNICHSTVLIYLMKTNQYL